MNLHTKLEYSTDGSSFQVIKIDNDFTPFSQTFETGERMKQTDNHLSPHKRVIKEPVTDASGQLVCDTDEDVTHLQAMLDACLGKAVTYQVTLKTGQVQKVDGIMTTSTPNAPAAGLFENSFTIQATGQMTVTAASASSG
ncbi:hypothetical protein KS4_18110 [Poriferisphaera corsica]|uniref:Uncharacterized protein n=1 Tax=Poriferisphaera corsica TaxID=2528020 RepID=A0A517YU33_9BACT|nr:hypothetical protein [Poriferisphaera corsica]QDU33754.1 hypothetical protein KS4_18110 [Poriferisphaera corsica]